jgi:hypothetical protein
MDELNFEFSDSFADFELDIDTEFETRYLKPPRTREVKESMLRYEDAKKLASELVIEPGSRHFVVVNGSFYFGDFIEALLVKNLWQAKEMTISTLSLNQNNVDSMANMLRYKSVKKLNVIVSDYFFAHERHNLIPYMYEELDMDNRFQLAVAGTHCKLCIFETVCGKSVVIHGSANMRSSGNIEQFMVEEGKALYKFNHDFQKRIIDKYKTINKSIRGKKLWQQVAADTPESTQSEATEHRQATEAEAPRPTLG